MRRRVFLTNFCYPLHNRSYDHFFDFQLTPISVKIGNSFGGFARNGRYTVPLNELPRFFRYFC